MFDYLTLFLGFGMIFVFIANLMKSNIDDKEDVENSSAKTPLISTWKPRPSGRGGKSHLTSFENRL
jgi:hypothetical protein